jgi:hypothetical protein
MVNCLFWKTSIDQKIFSGLQQLKIATIQPTASRSPDYWQMGQSTDMKGFYFVPSKVSPLRKYFQGLHAVQLWRPVSH